MTFFDRLQPTPEETMAEHQRNLRWAVQHIRLAGIFRPLTIVIAPLLVMSLLGVTTMLWIYGPQAEAYVGPAEEWVKQTLQYTGSFVFLNLLAVFWLTALHLRSEQVLTLGDKLVKAMEALAAWGLEQLADKEAPIETQMATLREKIHPRLRSISLAAMRTQNYTQSLLEEMEGRVWKSTDQTGPRILDIADPAEVMLSWLGWIGIVLALHQSVRPLYHLYFFFSTTWTG